MSAKQKRLDELRRTLTEISPREAFDAMGSGAVLVDIREADEVVQGSPRDAHRIVRGFLELQIEDRVPDLGHTVMLMCAGGARSLFATRDLLDMGYTDVRSVAGGFSAWKADELPTEIPRALSDSDRNRYSRHLLIPEVGEVGQLKLLESKVLLIGAGGLGSPAAFYLAAAGVGTLGIVDDDVVERSNLQRQILHTDDRVGTSKAASAQATLNALNPDIEIVPFAERLNASNAEAILKDFDLVVDGSDNFATRYLINDACLKLGKTNVHGSIFRFEGQVSVFSPGRSCGGGSEADEPLSPCYRCLFPDPPPPELAPSCAEAGVLGVLPGVIGTLQAIEAIKILLGIGRPLIGRLLVYDALQQQFLELAARRNPQCPSCGRPTEEIELLNHQNACAV